MAGGFLNFKTLRPGFLNFGDSGTVFNEFKIQSTLPPPTVSMQWMIGLRHQVTTGIPWQVATPALTTISSPCPAGTRLPITTGEAWSSGLRFPQTQSAHWSAGQPINSVTSSPWWSLDKIHSHHRLPWSAEERLALGDSIPWQAGTRWIFGVGAPWQAGERWIFGISAPWQAGEVILRDRVARWDYPPRTLVDLRIVWDNGIPPPHGSHPPPYVPPDPGKAWGTLNFSCLWPNRLDFGRLCQGAYNLLVPIRRSYRVINQGVLIRVSDSADIPVSQMTIALDWEAWCWTLSATIIGRTAYERIPSVLDTVQATINGFVWQFVVDKADYRRAFNSFSGTITGRSPIAQLAAPFANPRTGRAASLRTAQQLVLQEMPGAWTLDWDLPDWTVPGGVFEYQNLTPIEIIGRVVAACGGRMYPDPEDLLIHAVPKWPQKPWDWLTFIPDATLPSSYTLTESLQRSPGQEYEAVMVAGGVNSGVVVMARRDGTAGTTHAPSITDALLVHIDAATPRAVQVLADHWPMRRYTLTLPLQAQPAGAGLILPGTTLDFADGADGWRGLVVATQIAATWNDVKQTLELVAP